MIKYIYKVLELLYPEEDILNQKPIKKQVKPELLASVVCGEPRKVATYNEEGEKTGEEEVFNIQDYYPSFDKEIMIASDKKFIEPKLLGGIIVEGYVEPEIIEPVVKVEEVVLTDEETLEQLKNDIISISKELLIAREAGIGYNVDGLESARESLIEQHKELAETVAYTETEEEVSENV